MTLKPYVEESDSLLDMDGKSVNKVLRECEAWAVAISRAIKESRDKGLAVGAGGHANDQNAGRRFSTSGRPLDAKLMRSPMLAAVEAKAPASIAAMPPAPAPSANPEKMGPSSPAPWRRVDGYAVLKEEEPGVDDEGASWSAAVNISASVSGHREPGRGLPSPTRRRCARRTACPRRRGRPRAPGGPSPRGRRGPPRGGSPRHSRPGA